MEHPSIFEKNISEHVRIADMRIRINDFKQWLLQRPESNIVVVGHSAFFRDLLQTECKMENCEIRSASLAADGSFQSAEIVVAGGSSLLLNGSVSDAYSHTYR